MATSLTNRLLVFVRGIMLGQVLGKTLRLNAIEARDRAPTTLMDADIDGIMNGIPDVLGVPINALEIGIAIFDLTDLIGRATFLIALPLIC